MARPRNRQQTLSVAQAWDFLNRLTPGDRIYFAAGQSVDYTTLGEPCTVRQITTEETESQNLKTVNVSTHGGATYELEVSDACDRTWAYRIGGGRHPSGELVALEIADLRYSV